MVRMTRVSAFRGTTASERWGSSRLAPLTLVILGFLQPGFAFAQDVLPQGGSVVNGDVSIATPNAGHMVLNQGSDRAVVNWDGFSIGRGNSVDIIQPETSSAILNRVTGNTTSEIHGRLNANGQVFVVNPNGLMIGKDGEVSAGGGFVGSTLDTQDDDFMAGHLRFEGAGSSASIENAGRVVIGRGGFAALLGGQVSNSGLVMVPMGRIGLGAGEKITLDMSGDGFLQVEVPSSGGDDMLALIENSGTVSADGGLIEMKAATARHAARHAINLSGVAEARSVSVHNGTIVLGGGAGGRVTVSGRVSTRAKQPSGPAIIVEQSARPKARRGGGDIIITGRDIALTSAEIDASGLDGGGIIRIGGDYQGGGELPTALYLGVDAQSTITADAGETGDGGRIILWSDLKTSFAGDISAQGGAVSGDGGFVEVSGKEQLAFSGMVNTLAASGDAGTLLLDPFDVFIDEVIEDLDDDVGDPITVNFAAGTFTPIADDAVISVDLLESNLAQTNINITTGAGGTQNGDITVQSQIDWSAATKLTFQAAGDVILNAGINNALGDFEINAGGSITTGPAGTINVDSFELTNGTWTQLDAVLPDFSANDFVLGDNIETGFLRALGGEGTSGDPYQLADIYGLQGLSSFALLDQNFVLANDIDAAGAATWNNGNGFAAIEGLASTPFSGTLDGQGNSIIALSSAGAEAGLFAQTDGAEIRNLTLDSVAIRGFDTAGALVSRASDTTIENVAVTGIVANEFGTLVGGVVGDMRGLDGVINNSSFVGTVNSETEDDADLTIGGLVGSNFLSTLSNSTFSGTVRETGLTLAERIVGGAVGVNGGTVQSVTTSGTLFADGVGGPLTVGGLVGANQSLEGISQSTNTMTVRVVTSAEDAITAGGLVGDNIGAITESQSTGELSITAGGGDLAIGGLIGFNNNTDVRPVEDVAVTGAVVVVTTAPAEQNQIDAIGGLVGENYGPIDSGDAGGDVVVTSSRVTTYVGGFVGLNAPASDGGGPGEITASQARGNVSYETDLEGSVGGFAGRNEGSVVDAMAEGDASLSMVDFNGALDIDEYASAAGGFTGVNTGSQIRTASRGDVSGQTIDVSVDAGGHSAVQLAGVTRDAYANGAVDVTSNAQKTAGGLFGVAAGGALVNSYSSGAVSQSGAGTAFFGGLIGVSVGTVVSGSFWDVDTSGQTDPGDATRGEGINTADFEDTADFILRAEAAGWDFATVWAPGTSGRYPSIYTIDRVVFATPDAVALTYGQTTDVAGSGTVVGGPAVYVFAEDGETLDTSSIFTSVSLTDETVGTSAFAVDTTPLTSSADQTYAVVAQEGVAAISAAPLELTVDDATKTYGQALTFNGSEFTITGGELFFEDAVETVTIASAGAAAEASVADGPYAIIGGAPIEGTRLENYDITVLDGALTVERAPLELTANDATKTYGQLLNFDGTEFVVTGGTLFFADDVSTISIASDGAAADSEVAGSPYAISGGAPITGVGLENYDVTILDGALIVEPAPLELTVNDATTIYGETPVFDGTEFTVTEGTLFFADSVDTISISANAPDDETAGVASPIVGGEPITGTRFENYEITVIDGALTIGRALLELTVNDVTKTYGETVVFDGTEFTVTAGSLFFDDSVETISIISEGAAAEAQVASSPYVITGEVIGDGSENYDISIVDGALTVERAPLELTVNDVSKTYGDALSFAGTEFSVTQGTLFFDDSIDTIAITSEGALAGAVVIDDATYAILGAAPVTGTGADNYDVTILDGALSVDPAALAITPNDLIKIEGDTLVFDGTEFTTRGLVLDDTVESVTLASDGAVGEAALAAFDITASDPLGTGLENYDVTLETGTLTVIEPTEENQFTPDVPPQIELPNPPDSILILLPDGSGDETGGVSNAGNPSNNAALSQARETLLIVQKLASTLEIAAASCNEDSENVTRYLACLSDALDDFADELDAISTDLPPGMENVARIVRDARQNVTRASERAQARLAGASSQAERDQIAREAIGEAQVALTSAATEIRKAISFVRADDPELAAVQRATVTTVASAIDNVAIELSRVSEL